MSVKSIIQDPASGLEARVVNNTEINALAVATRPLKTFENNVSFFSNSDYGIDMNQDASAGGTPLNVYDGGDNPYWTATVITGGKFTLSSTDQNHTVAGTLSLKTDNADIGDTVQLSTITPVDLNNYVSISLWIYVDKDWNVGDSITLSGYDTATTSTIGTPVGLENFFSYGEYDVWHKIVIPLSVMDIQSSTIDAFRVSILTTEGKSPKFYIDDFAIEESGNPIIYSIRPALNTWLYVNEFTVSVASNIPSTLAGAGLPVLAYDTILGETVSSGLVYTRTSGGLVTFSLNIHSLMGMLQLPNSAIISSGSDGTNTFITVRISHYEPLLLKSEEDDRVFFTISDDLSGLLHFRISAGCKIEDRSKQY